MHQANKYKQPSFLPMSLKEMQALGWKQLDILLITGDAYVDHPGFGSALIGRWLVDAGYKVGIISQPDWKDPQSVTMMGRPRLMAGITAGAMDSMVANYTANKKRRHQDAYTPGGEFGKRPNRASIIYTNLIKQNYPNLPVVLGGVEASLRRLVHYDYWSTSIRRSLLIDAKADYLLYGMAEVGIVQLAQALEQQKDITSILGMAYISLTMPSQKAVILPSYESISTDKNQLMKAMIAAENNQSSPNPACLVQQHANRYLVVTPPPERLSTKMMDKIYALPFSRQAHPGYQKSIPALESVRHSITTHRGCFGGCSFCAIGAHQGKWIQSRSEASVLKEIDKLVNRSDFHGTITDVGGPSANMYGLSCQSRTGGCSRVSCLYPKRCQHLKVDHQDSINLLKKIKSKKQVKHVFVASGIRYDLALLDKRYLALLVNAGHVSGRLKVAPEHCDAQLLDLMRKPPASQFEQFVQHYRALCHQAGKHDGITAYFISDFPGSTIGKMQDAAKWARQLNLRVEQLQDFIPLPMTMAGVLFAVGKDPRSKEPLNINYQEKNRKQQRQALLEYAKSSGYLKHKKIKK